MFGGLKSGSRNLLTTPGRVTSIQSVHTPRPSYYKKLILTFSNTSNTTIIKLITIKLFICNVKLLIYYSYNHILFVWIKLIKKEKETLHRIKTLSDMIYYTLVIRPEVPSDRVRDFLYYREECCRSMDSKRTETLIIIKWGTVELRWKIF